MARRSGGLFITTRRQHKIDAPVDGIQRIIGSQADDVFAKTLALGAQGALSGAVPPLMIAEAPAEYITRAIERGGLSNQKAKAIRNLLDAVVAKFCEPTLEPLRAMSDKEAEAFLLSLPGVGKKIARCVLMYSLDRQVFPVDTHCWRIARRLGWVRPTQKDRHCAPRDMDRLQARIPPELRFSLHVNMVSLGREICLATKPKYELCPIAAQCRRIGVPRK